MAFVVQMVSAGYGSLPALLYWNVKSLRNLKVCELCCSIREFIVQVVTLCDRNDVGGIRVWGFCY